jgi:hypothetical protein
MKALGSFAAFVAIATVATLSPSAAGAALLPLNEVQFSSYNGFIGGTSTCSTQGTYDVDTYLWTQIGVCDPNVGLVIGETTVQREGFAQADLAGRVDNDGHLLGGAFSLSGILPNLGINDLTVLATGTLLDVRFGEVATSSGQSSFSMGTLVALDYVVEPLQSLGDVLFWVSNTSIAGWQRTPDGPGVAPWTTSVSPGDYRNFTGSQYFFYDRSVFFVPEPGTLALLVLGLAGFALTGLRKR